MDEYKFDKEAHIHTLDGKPLVGVTTALGVISKPMLIQWSANMAVGYIDGRVREIIVDSELTKAGAWDVLEADWDEITKEAKVAHRKKKEKAGDWGTEVHKAIEEWVKEKKEPVFVDNTQMMVFEKFRTWAAQNKVEFIESEKNVWSRELWIGGICDLVLKMDGKKYIADIKTSSGIYNEAFFQMGAYNLCLEEKGEHRDVEGYIVINLKKDGTMDLKMATDMELNKQAFKHALGLHKIINSLK